MAPQGNAAGRGAASTRTSRAEAERQIFVAYPWSVYPNRANYKKAYSDLERPLGVTFIFAEERISTSHVLDKIIAMIEGAVFGIYDVTGWNPNVTLEYGIARGIGAKAFIAFNPDQTNKDDVPADVRGYDRLQYRDFTELSEKVTTLIGQELGSAPRPIDPVESDRRKLIALIGASPGQTVRQLAEVMDQRIDYVQLLLRRSESELRTEGQTRGQRYFVR